MKILVVGGTGTVGSHVVRELVKREVKVTVLTRKTKVEAELPEGVVYLRGNLLDPKTVRTMCKNMDGLFLLNAVSTTETHEGLMAVNGARISDIKKIVYMSVFDAEKAPHLPHFGAKIPIEIAVKLSGIPYAILRPNSFFQNDYWSKDAILKFGTYPQPMGNIGLSRVDVRDIAEAAAITLTDDKYQHDTFNLVGPEILTGEHIAQIWSNALRKEIKYGGNNLDKWEKQSREHLPDWMVFDFKLMFEFFQKEGLKGSREDIRRLTALLGHPPRRLEDFALETAQMWKKDVVA